MLRDAGEPTDLVEEVGSCFQSIGVSSRGHKGVMGLDILLASEFHRGLR